MPRLVRIKGRRKWYVVFTEGRRSKTKSTGLESKELAQQWLQEFIAARQRPRNDPTIAELVEKRADFRLPHVAAPKQFRYYADRNIAMFGALKWDQLPLNPKASRRQLEELQATLTYAYDRGWIPHKIKIAMPQRGQPRDRFLTVEQAHALLEAARPIHLRLFIQIALSTGARRGAILGLTWNRVLWPQKILDFTDPDRPITNKRRVAVRVQNKLLDTLRQAQEVAVTDHVIEYNAKPVESIKTAFRKAARDAGLPWCTPHVLKHSAVSWLAELGWTVDQIADFTGTHHNTVRRVYRKFSPDYLQDVSASLAERLGNGGRDRI